MIKHTLLLLALLFSCSPQSDSTAKMAHAGTLDSNSPLKKHSVALIQKMGSSLEHVCSGAIISDRHILTAAHCNKYFNFVVFGDDIHTEGVEMRGYNTVTVHPWYDEKSITGNNYDIMVVEIQGSLPDGFEPINLLSKTEELTDDTYTLVGYGLNEDGKSGNQNTLDVTYQGYYNNIFFKNLFLIKTPPKKYVCQGDSGGPAYLKVNGEWKVAGIARGSADVHFATAYPDDTLPEGCVIENVLYTFVGAYKQWISDAIGGLTGEIATTEESGAEDLNSTEPQITDALSYCTQNQIARTHYDTLYVQSMWLELEWIDFTCDLFTSKLLEVKDYCITCFSDWPLGKIADLSPLTLFKNLEILVLNNLTDGYQNFNRLAELTQLKILDLRGIAPLTQSEINILKGLPHLEEVYFEFSTTPSSAIITALKSLPIVTKRCENGPLNEMNKDTGGCTPTEE